MIYDSLKQIIDDKQIVASKSRTEKILKFLNSKELSNEFRFLREDIDESEDREDYLIENRKNRYGDVSPCNIM